MEAEQLAITLKEASHMVSLGMTKLRELLASGEIPSFKVGSAVRVPVRALREWVSRQAANGEAPTDAR